MLLPKKAPPVERFPAGMAEEKQIAPASTDVDYPYPSQGLCLLAGISTTPCPGAIPKPGNCQPSSDGLYHLRWTCP
jgi:hypothetical protein